MKRKTPYNCSFFPDGGAEKSASALPLMLSFTGEGESLQAHEGLKEGACPSFLLAYIFSPLGVDEEEEGGERKGKVRLERNG